jgi:hypothetical protein
VGTRRRTFWRSRYDDEIRLLLAGLEAAVPDAEVVLDYERTTQLLRLFPARQREDFLREHPEAIELEAAQPGPRPTAGFFGIREWERRAGEWERRVAAYLEEHPEAEGLVVRPVRPAPQDPVLNLYAPLPPFEDVLVQVVLPTAVGAIVTAVTQTAVGWLRSLGHKPEREHAVLIYGPNGEPLREIRLRPGRRKPEIFKRD